MPVKMLSLLSTRWPQLPKWRGDPRNSAAAHTQPHTHIIRALLLPICTPYTDFMIHISPGQWQLAHPAILSHLPRCTPCTPSGAPISSTATACTATHSHIMCTPCYILRGAPISNSTATACVAIYTLTSNNMHIIYTYQVRGAPCTYQQHTDSLRSKTQTSNVYYTLFYTWTEYFQNTEDCVFFGLVMNRVVQINP